MQNDRSTDEGRSLEKVVLVAREDLWQYCKVTGEGDELTVCGVHALEMLNAALRDPDVVRIEVIPLEEVRKEVAEEKNLFIIPSHCVINGCENTPTLNILLWRYEQKRSIKPF